MILECTHCGAPLDVVEGSSLVRCVYCRVTTERTRMRTLHAQRPADFRPPVKWTPPPHVPADSNVTLAYQPSTSNAGVMVTFVVIGVIVSVIALIVAQGVGKAGISGLATKELAKVKLEKGPASIGQKLGANISETSIYVRLDDPRYEYLTLSWDKAHPEAPTSFYFGVRKGQQPDPGAAARVAKHLRGGLDKNRSWQWEGVYFSIGEDGHFNGSVRTDRGGRPGNPLWQKQIDLLFRVALADVLSVKGVTVGEEELRTLLALGYPLSDLAKIDPQLTVDHAEEAMLEKFPGAQSIGNSNVEIAVPVDHPWVLALKFTWNNQKGAVLETVRVAPTGGYDALGPRLGDLARCYTKAFGAPRVSDTDYMKKKKSYDFTLPGGATLYLAEYSLDLRAPWDNKKQLDQKTLATYMMTLDTCRGS